MPLWPCVEGRAQLVDQRRGLPLELRELLALVGDEPLERELGRHSGVLHNLARPRRREALVDEAREHVVDALARNVRQPCGLRRRRRVAAEQREIRLRLVAREPEAGELGGGGHCRTRVFTTTVGVNSGAGRGSAP